MKNKKIVTLALTIMSLFAAVSTVAAEEAKDTEKPELPLSNIQNALIFKRMTARRQLMGSVLQMIIMFV